MGPKRIAKGIENSSTTKKKKLFKENALFTLEDISGRFPLLSEAIFNEVDDQSLTKCREVNDTWKTTLDNQKNILEQIHQEENPKI